MANILLVKIEIMVTIPIITSAITFTVLIKFRFFLGREIRFSVMIFVIISGNPKVQMAAKKNPHELIIE